MRRRSTSEPERDPKHVPTDPLDQNVSLLVTSLLLKVQTKEPVTEADTLKTVSKGCEGHFAETMPTEVTFGPTHHCHALRFNMDLTWDGVLHGERGVPKTGTPILTWGQPSPRVTTPPERRSGKF